jgi:hypothetical protein
MHYANGRQAAENDPVICKPSYPGGRFLAGTIHSLATNPNCTSCNGQIAYPMTNGIQNTSVTVSDCYHAEDAFNAISPKLNITPSPPA